MNILITGGSGFIGRNLYLKLSRMHNITLISRRKRNKNIQFIKADLSNKQIVEQIISQRKIQVIYHLGGISGITNKSFNEYLKANILPSKILSDLSNRYNIKIIYLSSAGVYGTAKKNISENSKYDLDCPYHYSKKLAEDQIRKAKKHIILRPTVTYGLFDKGMVYKLITLAKKGIFFKNVTLHLLSVNALVEELNQCIEKENFEAIIADKRPIELNEIYKLLNQRGIKRKLTLKLPWRTIFKINKNWGLRAKLISENQSYDISKIISLGYKPRETLPELRKVIEYYLS